MRKRLLAFVCLGWMFPATALAQAPAPPPAVVVTEPARPTDGVRFRGGIAAAGGGEFISGFAVGMGGIEGRAGVQINHLLGVYAQPHLSFGGGTVSSGGVTATTLTGTAGVSGLVDLTLAHRFFVGAGGGFGVLNNPTGPALHFRLGGYPVMGFGRNGYTRMGLMVGADARFFFLSAGSTSLVVAQIMGSVGYEAF